MGEYKELNVTCPVCQAEKSINVPEAIFGQKKFGTFKIQVPAQAVCDHTFIVFVDTKGIIRGYEKIDIMMATPAAVSKAPEEAGRVTLKTFIEFFGIYGLFSLMHAKVFNYPAYVIKSREDDFKAINETMNRIGERLLPEAYRGTSGLQFLEKTDYGKIKVKEKDALIIDAQKNILQTPWEEKLKFEESIIKKALEIFDDEEQMIILKQDIAKLAKESEAVREILEPVKEMYEDELIDELARKLMIPKINHDRLTLIKEFIKRRFSEKTARKIKNKVEEFLGLI